MNKVFGLVELNLTKYSLDIKALSQYLSIEMKVYNNISFYVLIEIEKIYYNQLTLYEQRNVKWSLNIFIYLSNYF